MIRILEGRVGSGKTSRVLSEIVEAVRDGQRALWIVPEQMTLQAELMLAQALEAPGFLLAEVLSPSRLISRALEAAGGLAGHTLIDERGRAFALRACLADLDGRLAFYRGCGSRPGFVEWLLQLTDELSRNEMTSTDLRLCADRLPESSLQWKLYDLSALLDRYRETLKGRYLDSVDAQALFRERAGDVEFIRDALVWVDGFDIMPPQTVRQVAALGAAAREVTVALTAPPEVDSPGGDDLFAAVDGSRQRLMAYAAEAGVSILREIMERQAYHSPEIGHLEAQWEALRPEQYAGAPQDIALCAAANPREEAEACASTILGLARQEGMRYREMAVVAGGLDGYAPYIRRAFAARGIPCFIASNLAASEHPAARYWLAAMEAATTGYRREAMLRALRSGFAGVTEGEMEALANRQFTRGLWGSGWLAPIEDDAALEEARLAFLRPMLAFQARIRKAESLAAMAEAAYQLLEDAGIYDRLFEDMEHLDQQRPEWAQQNAQIWQGLLDALDQAVELMGQRPMPFAHLLLALRSTLEGMTLAALPPLPDAVLVTDVARVKGSGIKVLFVLGLNDGLLPAAGEPGALLGDRERADINESATALGLTGRLLGSVEQDQAERFSIYAALTLPTHRLYLSYALAEESGAARQPSVLLGHLQGIFPALAVRPPKDAAYDRAELALWNAASRTVRSRGEDERAIAIWHALSRRQEHERDAGGILALFADAPEERLPPRESRILLGRDVHMGVTRLERYAACPYQHFVSHALRPRELYPPGIRPLDAGVFYHDALQRFVEQVRDNASWSGLEEETLKRLLAQASRQAMEPILKAQQDSPRLRARAGEMLRVAEASAKVLARQLGDSQFLPLLLEMEFGRGKPYPPWPLPLEDGSTLLLEGRVDRVDAMQRDGETLIRVIDYKSSPRGLSEEEVEQGLTLQLPIYARMAAQELNARVAGFFYFAFARSLVSGTEDVERAIANKYKLRGRLLADPDIALAMDPCLGKSSDVLPVRLKNDGNFYAGDPVYTPQEMKQRLDGAMDAAAGLAQRMLAGDIAPQPGGKKNPCQYCPYAAICGAT